VTLSSGKPSLGSSRQDCTWNGCCWSEGPARTFLGMEDVALSSGNPSTELKKGDDVNAVQKHQAAARWDCSEGPARTFIEEDMALSSGKPSCHHCKKTRMDHFSLWDVLVGCFVLGYVDPLICRKTRNRSWRGHVGGNGFGVQPEPPSTEDDRGGRYSPFLGRPASKTKMGKDEGSRSRVTRMVDSDKLHKGATMFGIRPLRRCGCSFRSCRPHRPLRFPNCR